MIEASIIMPTHNRYPLNLLTLYSLENQTYDPSRFEVLLVDDASTDATRYMIERHKFPYELRYIRSLSNVGRPQARNIGIRAARGTHLIFMDAEILVEPYFVESHMSLHLRHSRLVASGINSIKKVYTHIHAGLSPEQRQEAIYLLERQPDLYNLWQSTAHLSDPPPLFTRQDIHTGRHKALSAANPYSDYYEQEIFQPYGDWLSGFHLPWVLSSTGNLSVSRETVERYGGFEEYDGWGSDDIEFGYRLYLQGYQFVNVRHPASYHQEHPVLGAKKQEAKINFFRFQQKYREVSLLVILLSEIPNPLRIGEISRVLNDVYAVGVHEHPYRFLHLTSTFRAMLEAVGYLNRFDLPVSHLFAHSGILDPSPEKDLFFAEKQALAASGKYPYLNYAIDRLLVL